MRMICLFMLLSIGLKAQTLRDTLSYSGELMSKSATMYAVGGTLAMGGIGFILIGDKLGFEGIETMGGILTFSSFPFIVIGINLQKKSGDILKNEDYY